MMVVMIPPVLKLILLIMMVLRQGIRVIATIVDKRGKFTITEMHRLTCCSHNKSDCPNPRVFQGTCRVCEKEGHPASQCPDKPADKCRNCGEEGKLGHPMPTP